MVSELHDFGSKYGNFLERLAYAAVGFAIGCFGTGLIKDYVYHTRGLQQEVEIQRLKTIETLIETCGDQLSPEALSKFLEENKLSKSDKKDN